MRIFQKITGFPNTVDISNQVINRFDHKVIGLDDSISGRHSILKRIVGSIKPFGNINGFDTRMVWKDSHYCNLWIVGFGLAQGTGNHAIKTTIMTDIKVSNPIIDDVLPDSI